MYGVLQPHGYSTTSLKLAATQRQTSAFSYIKVSCRCHPCHYQCHIRAQRHGPHPRLPRTPTHSPVSRVQPLKPAVDNWLGQEPSSHSSHFIVAEVIPSVPTPWRCAQVCCPRDWIRRRLRMIAPHAHGRHSRDTGTAVVCLSVVRHARENQVDCSSTPA
jgi:hypothetical protein